MLLSLAIRDVVLIDRLDLSFRTGLCVLTGETGAGKSILLDALGLALGVRAESGLVRQGADQASVTAEFSLASDHPVRQRLADAGIAAEGDTLVLRRIVGKDGRSRAFVDDQPASVSLLRQVGELLVEIEGQFAQRGLLDETTHRRLLDEFGGYPAALEGLGVAWRSWTAIARERREAEAALAAARAEEEYLRHSLAEIDVLDPRSGEGDALTDDRALLMNRERLIEALEAALLDLGGERGGERSLHTAARHLERLLDRAGGRLDPALAALQRAALEAREATEQIEAIVRGLGNDRKRLDSIEERLFALRALARKHAVSIDDLPRVRTEFAARIAALDDGSDRVVRLQRLEQETRSAYIAAAEVVTRERRRAAKSLDAAVMKELAPLRLEKARFATVITDLDDSNWGEAGRERVHFEVATNPGSAAGPLSKIASGGELARFMLALKVVLAMSSPVPTLVFDEVDSGIGGAVAAAVGERLERLGRDLQVLVVTHSPQVAARGTHHWRVAKSQAATRTLTRVDELTLDERCEEIARMLSGAAITAEARAAAASLIAGAAP